MTDAELLVKVKKGLGIMTDYQDDTLEIYIEEVKSYMIDGGVPVSVANSPASVGCIITGVNDLWNYSAGGSKFSPYFEQRLVQLATTKVVGDV